MLVSRWPSITVQNFNLHVGQDEKTSWVILMLIVWTFTEAVLKQKKGITAVPKRGTDGDHITYTQTLTHTHTHTHSRPSNYNSLLWLHGPAFDQLLNTVALQSLKQALTASNHWQSACIHYGTLFGQRKCFCSASEMIAWLGICPTCGDNTEWE